MLKAMAAVFVVLLVVPCSGYCADFFINMDRCKTTTGFLTPSGTELKAVDAQTYSMVCTRAAKSLVCDVSYRNDGKVDKDTDVGYAVVSDTPPMLILAGETKAGSAASTTRIVVNTKNGVAVSVTNLFDDTFATSKVCRGSYLTAAELKLLLKIAQ